MSLLRLLRLLRILGLRALFWAAFKLLDAEERVLGLAQLKPSEDNAP